jgi:ribosomal protein S18 acetylase RimI-like enzyme
MRIRRIVIRRLLSSDEGFVEELAREAFSAWSRDPSRVVMKMVRQGATAAIATHDDQPVGMAVVSFTALGRPMGPWPAPKIARVEAIATARKGRKRGVGTALMAWAEGEARRNGAVVMRLLTAETNRSARRLFYHEGFMAVLRAPNAYANGEAGIEMFKPLLEEEVEEAPDAAG